MHDTGRRIIAGRLIRKCSSEEYSDQCSPQLKDGSGALSTPGTRYCARPSRAKQTGPHFYPGAISSELDAQILIKALEDGLLNHDCGFDSGDQGWPPYGLTFIHKTIYNTKPSSGIVQTTSESDLEMITVDLPTLHGVYRVTSWVMGVNSKRRTPSEDPRMYLSHLQVNLDCSPAAKKSFQCIALYISIGIIDSPDTQSYVNLLKRAEADWIPLCPYEIGHWEKVSERSEFNGLSASQLRDRTMTLLSRIERMAMGHLTQHYTPWNENFTPHQDLTLLGIAFKLKTSPPASLLRIDTNRLAVDLQDNPIFNVQGIEDVQGPIRRANQILPIFRGKDWLELPTSLQNILDELSNDNEEYFIAFITFYHRRLLSLNERKNDELFLIIYLSHRHASPRLQVWVESEVGCLVHAKILGRLRDSTDVAEFMLCMIALYAMHRLVKRETENEAHWCGDWLAQWNRYLYKLDDFETHYRTVQCVFASLARVLRCHINIKDPTLSLVASELTDFEEGVHFCPSFVEDSYLYKRICLGMNHRKAYDGVRKDAFISYKRLQKSSDEMEGSWVLIEQAEEQIHLDKTDPLGQDRSTRT